MSAKKRDTIEAKEQGIQQGMQQGMQKGIQQGIQKGIQQGIQKGIQQGIQNVAKNILQQLKLGIDVVKQATGLSDRELRQLANVMPKIGK